MLNNKKESKGYYHDVYYLQLILMNDYDFSAEIEETKRGNLAVTCTIISGDRSKRTETIMIEAKDRDEVLEFMAQQEIDTTWYN